MKLTYCILAHLVTVYVLCQDYDDHLRLFRDKFKSENYSTDIRPLRNQSRTLFVSVNFHVLNIVGIDDIAQSFTCNGLFDFIWVDEILAWDPSDYNGQWVINPKPVDIWRPRLMLTNTLDKRDLFEDDLAPVTVTSHGIVRWFPGSLFTSSCELNMVNYPFDRHECTVEKEEHLLKVRAYFSRAINKITKLRHAASPMTGAAEDKINQIEDLGNEYGTPGTETDKQESKKQKQEGPMGNRYNIIGRYIDQVSFAVFLVMWSAATITVMIKITAKQPFTIDTTEYKTRELDL